MLKGLPRTGKSTYAKKYVISSGNHVRVNRDDLRQMLHNGKWSHLNEKSTILAQEAIVRAMLLNGKSVLVDDTNLTEKHKNKWSSIARECGSTFMTKEFTNDLPALVQRDNKAEEGNKRGRHVIENMAIQHGYTTFEDDSLVLCDIDGTIADCMHRVHHVTKEPKDWKSFFDEMGNDTLKTFTFKMLLDFFKDGKRIIFVSARPEQYRKMTEDWLRKHNMIPWNEPSTRSLFSANSITGDIIPYDALILRKENDSREDTIVKQQILDTFFDKRTISHVIDDRPCVVRMWKENGLNVIDVGDGKEF